MLPVRMLGLLVLMFLRRAGADSTCPAELNPLTLEPAEVIEEYQQPVSVNCTSSEEFYDDMFLRLGNTDHSADGEQTIENSLLLSDWNITAECRIKVNATLECSKDLKITIYKNPAKVFMPPVTSVVERTPYALQCDVFDVAPSQNLIVRWYKDNRTIHTESFNHTINKTPVNMSSVLEVNLNRREDGAQFKCEAQLDFGPYGSQPPVTSDTHEVSVHYAPEFKDKKTFEITTLYEGVNDVLNCEAEGNPPPVFEWTTGGVNILGNTSSLNITVNTSATYICTATNYLRSINKPIYVRMLPRPRVTTPAVVTTVAVTPEASAPRDCPLTLTPDEVVVRFGDNVSVFCNTSETDVYGMGWEVSSGGTEFIKDVTALHWTVEKLEEWDIKPLCHITLDDGYQCQQTPHVTLYKTPDAVTVSANHSEMVEGGDYLLNCDIINVTPVQNLTVKWYRGDDMVYSHRYNGTSDKPVNVSSTLRITAERHHNGTLLRCEAELQLGPKGPQPFPTESSSPYTAVVLYKPLIQDCPGHHTAEEHKFSLDMLSCDADANPATTVQWYYQGKPIDASMKLDRTHSGKFTVKAENRFGTINTSIDITVEYKPSFTCNGSYKVQEGADPRTLCESKGMPKPTVTWLKDGISKGTPRPWKRDDSGEYILKASNKYGEATHKLNINVLYAPVFMEENHTKEAALGENVTFECRAEGNPAPAIHWNFTSAVNVMATTGWRQGSITVTGATSTNAGVYICVATNEIGSVTRSVTLVMKGKTGGVPSWLFWLFIVLIIFIVIILAIICRNCWKKHGQYSFVSNKDSDIPLTSKSDGVKA